MSDENALVSMSTRQCRLSDRVWRSEAAGHSWASTASIPVTPAWMPRLIWSMTEEPPFETVCGQLQLRSLNTLGSAPLGAANPIDTARTVAPLNNIFVITRRSP